MKTEAFSTFNLDFLTLATVTVILTAWIRARTADHLSKLLGEAQSMLQDMASRGNTAASEVLQKLPSMDLAVTLRPSSAALSSPASYPSIDVLLASFDGRLLNKEMLEMITLDAGRDLIIRNNKQALTDLPNAEATVLSFTTGPYLDSLGSGEDFSFDMEDLQWLDSVQ